MSEKKTALGTGPVRAVWGNTDPRRNWIRRTQKVMAP